MMQMETIGLIKKWLGVLLVCVLMNPYMASQAQSKPDLAEYAKPAQVSMMTVSDDGQAIAFRKKTQDEDTIRVFSLTSNSFVRVYDISGMSAHSLYFLDLHRLVLVLREDELRVGYGYKMDVSTAMLLNIEDGSIKQLLTPGDTIWVGQTGLGKIIGVSPHRKHIYMPAYVRSVERSGLSRFEYAVMQVDLSAPETPKQIGRSNIHARKFFMDSAGNLVARELFDDIKNRHRLQVKRGKQWVTVFEENVELPRLKFFGLSVDGQSIVVIRNSKDSVNEYLLMSMDDGSLKSLNIDLRNTDIKFVRKTLDSKVTGVGFGGFLTRYHFFDPVVNEKIRIIQSRFPKQNVKVASHSGDWQYIVVHVSGATTSGAYYLFSDKQRPRFLAHSRPGVKNEHVHPVIQSSYVARDGLTLPLLLTVPQESLDTLTNLPAVMLPHGGPESHDEVGFNWLAQALANEGYLVIQPQFRGSTGFGSKIRLGGQGQWGKKMQTDLDDALHFLSKEKILDPNRVCILGASYGGYAALAAGALNTHDYKCIVSINGVTDLNALLAQQKNDHGRFSSVVSYVERIIKNNELSRGDLKKVSPAKLADGYTAPVLLIHGEDDDIVKMKQSKMMHKALRKKKKASKLIVLKNEGHHLEQEASRYKVLNESIDFIHNNIGAR